MRHWLLASLLVGLLGPGPSAPALADQPLPPPEPWTGQYDGRILVIAAPVRPQLVLAPPSGPGWAIPLWRYPGGIHPSPDGQSALISNLGGSLMAQGDPSSVVLQLYRAPGDLVRSVTRQELIATEALTPTVSNFLWIDSYTWTGTGWQFETPDGQAWRSEAETGALERL